MKELTEMKLLLTQRMYMAGDILKVFPFFFEINKLHLTLLSALMFSNVL